ncbi:MAG: lamin tail domain-containing protein, partial [Cytophagia bacterium]|nr:lamin tail domain-containing protein [Cytophagia bacterium]
SKNDTDFSATISFTAAEATTNQTVYVRFSPISGVNQTINGTILAKSLGSANQSFNVSGTETGNVSGTGTLMIYEVYGGGGNTGATYTNDFVVLYNGTAQAINLSNYSLHYASNTGAFGTTNNANLSGTINAGDYFLIQLAAGATVTDKPLPTPDLVAVLHNNAAQTINLSGSNGKIVLATGAGNTALTGGTDTRIVDLVGYGTANLFEGASAVGALTNSTSAKRKTFVDTNDNGVDFAVVTPNLAYVQ